jgi:hypothetical protein
LNEIKCVGHVARWKVSIKMNPELQWEIIREINILEELDVGGNLEQIA